MALLSLIKNFRAPALPLATKQYDEQATNQMANILRLYFNQLDQLLGRIVGNWASQTWTPTISFGGASVGVVYTTQYGDYIDDGVYVTASFRVVTTSKGSSTGTMTIGGLPIANTSDVNASLTGAGPLSGYTGFTGLTSQVVPGMTTASATTFALLHLGVPITNTSCTNTLNINGWIRYKK